MSFLRQPSKKIFVKDLTILDDQSNNLSLNNSKIYDCNERSPIQLGPGTSVWIQGDVVQVSPEESSAVLDDGTGTVLIMPTDKVTTKLNLKKGMYVQCVGSVHQTGSQPLVRPVKLQDLSQMDHVDVLWPLEVIDQKRFL